ncbi:hypothetical protein EOD39_7012 [Acipenser ruthenus]|uniref:Cyanocobalamin reductase / alkylcobalamin dealkylase n=1 Tax=Acipenser ruthenus TaxID=7906 RepID=A0A444U8B5_ACIRT|nr:hypothetical protein EOD39_7012 [Acipenser ruthenus]
MAAPASIVEGFERSLRECLSPFGFEVQPFKVGWYNAVLQPSLHLSHPEDTLAVLVLSAPQMFEKAFKPFLKNREFKNIRDPIDECVAHYVSRAVSQSFPAQKVEVSYDYEMLPNRRPRFLAQTAAHAAGAAYYYQRKDITADPWGNKKMYGVCMHPRYRGWFAIRALLVFPGVGAEGLVQRDPPDCVPSQELRIELLERFNLRWQDWSYRDIVPVEERYSEEQKTYFNTPPADRLKLLQESGDLQICPSY